MVHGADGSGEPYRLGAPLTNGTACRIRVLLRQVDFQKLFRASWVHR